MRISKFKKYVTWNIISAIGYLSLTVAGYFLVTLLLVASQIGMRHDLNGIFFDYMFNHVILPYLDVYKMQLIAVCLLLLCSVAEKKYYDKNGDFGLRIFENCEKAYSIIFVIGLSLNFLPLYLFFFSVLKTFIKLV